jgi:hypothetical protein
MSGLVFLEVCYVRREALKLSWGQVGVNDTDAAVSVCGGSYWCSLSGTKME